MMRVRFVFALACIVAVVAGLVVGAYASVIAATGGL